MADSGAKLAYLSEEAAQTGENAVRKDTDILRSDPTPLQLRAAVKEIFTHASRHHRGMKLDPAVLAEALDAIPRRLPSATLYEKRVLARVVLHASKLPPEVGAKILYTAAYQAHLLSYISHLHLNGRWPSQKEEENRRTLEHRAVSSWAGAMCQIGKDKTSHF